MNIILYNNKSENEKVAKDIEELATLTGTLRKATSITNPVIVIEHNFDTNINYCYIEEFGRYYYIEDIILISNSLMELHLRCDVLMSFADSIKSQKAIIKRNTFLYNLYLDDGTFKCYQDINTVTRVFPNSFNNETFVLAIAGNT